MGTDTEIVRTCLRSRATKWHPWAQTWLSGAVFALNHCAVLLLAKDASSPQMLEAGRRQDGRWWEAEGAEAQVSQWGQEREGGWPSVTPWAYVTASLCFPVPNSNGKRGLTKGPCLESQGREEGGQCGRSLTRPLPGPRQRLARGAGVRKNFGHLFTPGVAAEAPGVCRGAVHRWATVESRVGVRCPRPRKEHASALHSPQETVLPAPTSWALSARPISTQWPNCQIWLSEPWISAINGSCFKRHRLNDTYEI